MKTKTNLESIGFRDVAFWQPNGELLQHVGDNPNEWDALLAVQRALYAFVLDEKVCYIGKTSQNLKVRFVGYCNPGRTQQTNYRCNKKIKECLANGETVRILVFHDMGHLRWDEYMIDLPAGLETSLIRAFVPAWNTPRGEQKISESEELESLALPSERPREKMGQPSLQVAAVDPKPSFNIELGRTYYRSGFINVPMASDQYLGKDGESIAVYLGSENEVIESTINRTANQNRTVRISRNTRPIAEWFQGHFKLGDTVSGSILSPNKLLLRSKG